MQKDAVLAYYKRLLPDRSPIQAVAEVLRITHQAVRSWRPLIPKGVAYELQVLSGGVLRVNPDDYVGAPKQGRKPKQKPVLALVEKSGT